MIGSAPGDKEARHKPCGVNNMAATPYDSFDGVIWWNGSFVDWKDAKVHVLTHGLHYGSSIFEGERAYDGTIFKSREHSERLVRSAEIMGMKLPYTVDQIEAAKAETFKRMGFTDALAGLDRMRQRGATAAEVADAFPPELLKLVGYFGTADGAAGAFRRLSEGLDVSIVRVVAARPGVDAVRAALQACRPELVQSAKAALSAPGRS